MWLIYDYRQPDFMDNLRPAEIPTVPKANFYFDYPNPCALAGCKNQKTLTIRQAEQESPGFMGQSRPWDIACLYPDASDGWPGSSNATSAPAGKADIAHEDPAPLHIDGAANPELRAKATEPTASLLARFAPLS